MQEMAPRFSKFSGGGVGGGGGGGGWGGGGGGADPLANSLPLLGRGEGGGRTPRANSLASLGRAPQIITLQSIFETWQACQRTIE